MQTVQLEKHRLPDAHSLVDRFGTLLPKPHFFPDLLNAQHSDSTFPLDSIALIIRLCNFLLQPNQDQALDAFKRNDVLQALESLLRQAIPLLSLTSDDRENLRKISKLVKDIVDSYIECGSTRTDSTSYLDYMFQHLTLLCITSTVFMEGIWGLDDVQILVDERPLNSAWG